MIDNFILLALGIGEALLSLMFITLGVELVKGEKDLVGPGLVNRIFGVIWGVAAIVFAGGFGGVAAFTFWLVFAT